MTLSRKATKAQLMQPHRLSIDAQGFIVIPDRGTTVPGLLATTYGYQPDGKLLSVTSGARTTGYTYDTDGNLATITDPLTRVTRFTAYDEVGRLKRVERTDNSVVQYDYDENGNMTLYRTPYPVDNIFDYNRVDKPSSFVTPLGSTTSYSYNEERQLARVTLPSTKAIVNTYSSGRLTETTTPEWTNVYQYHCGDQLGSISRGAEKIAYSYDGSLLTGIVQSGILTGSLGLSYNNDFQLAAFTYGGATAALAYDNDGLLVSCDLPKSSHTLCRISGHKKTADIWCFAELNRSFGEDLT